MDSQRNLDPPRIHPQLAFALHYLIGASFLGLRADAELPFSVSTLKKTEYGSIRYFNTYLGLVEAERCQGLVHLISFLAPVLDSRTSQRTVKTWVRFDSSSSRSLRLCMSDKVPKTAGRLKHVCTFPS